MSTMKDKVIDDSNARHREANFKAELRKRTKEELWHSRTKAWQERQQAMNERDEALREVALLKEQDQSEALRLTIANRDRQITELDGEVKRLKAITNSLGVIAQDNHRLAVTLERVAAMGEALVPKPNVSLTPR